MDNHPIIVAYGGGTNSTAMLCGFRERDIRPSLILFADTGGELPHTYEHLRVMSDKCQEWFGLPIETVFKTYKGEQTSLGNRLPSQQSDPIAGLWAQSLLREIQD
jgi:3'-phosphoadenosine 5'-phosphosulfate sulfotransferase (PAPS reductase)/FAD synthetase